MVIWIPTFMLTALLQCWQLAPITASQHNELCLKITPFPVQKVFWLSISFKMSSQNGETINVTWHQIKRKVINKNLETVSDLIQRNKFTFLLISAKKDSLCSGIQTYFSWNKNYRSVILCFSNIPPLEP